MDQSQLYQLYDREPEPIASFLEHLRTLYDLPRPGVFLDMGCGPGRLLGPMAASGWTVVGYEPDPDYSLQAEETLRGLPNGRFRQAGLLELDEHQAFDLIAAVNGPYSYLLTPGDREEALRRCGQALRPGGVLFIEFSNFHWILKNYREPPVVQMDVGGIEVTRTAHHEIDYHNGTFIHHDKFVWTDTSGVDHEATKTHRMAIISYPELSYFLEDLHFEEIRTFNGFDDREARPLMGRRILVAARAPTVSSPTA
ncbi:MAG: class I SAM-dependent methyltransferase [Gemmatimonadota bacterium]|jgi:SAM-dependent methyltransferase